MTSPGTSSRQEMTLPVTPGKSRPFLSMTAALVAANFLVFLMMAASSHHILKFDGGLVLRRGGNYGPFTMDGQPWRLVSAMFVHIGLVHLLINMWCLYEIGALTEEIYGRSSLLILYGLTGLAGGIASLARSPEIISAGASGAVFGLAGIAMATLMVGRPSVPRRHLIIALGSLIAFAAYNLTYGFLKGGVDNGAHVGGLVSGLLIGIAMSHSAGRLRKTRRREGLVFGVVLVLLVAGYAAVRRTRGEVVDIEEAREAVANGDPDTALLRLSTVRTAANNSTVQEIMAAAYAERKQYLEAENAMSVPCSWIPATSRRAAG